eukprot:3789237-Rhodomonas_salina.4
MMLLAHYAMSGANVGYDATRALCCVREWPLLWCYTLATRCAVLSAGCYALATRCPVLSQGMLIGYGATLALLDVRYCARGQGPSRPIPLRACYAMSGTDLAYGGTELAYAATRCCCTGQRIAEESSGYRPTRVLRDVRY